MFDKVYGHERNKEIIGRQVRGGHLHHGLCMHGPSGIGKRLFAHELAMVLLCENQKGDCGCKHCNKMQSGSHPDFREITPDGQDIKVDQIREISANLHFRPFEARVRIILLDQVERMADSAANAFLKSLEEPPEYVFFFLITSDLKALLPTILSRCQKLGFQSLNQDDKAKILLHRFNKSPEWAQRLAGISFRQLETEEAAWDLFLEDVKFSLQFLGMILSQGHAMDAFSELSRDKEAFPRMKEHLLVVVRECCRLAAKLKPQPIFEPFATLMAELAAKAKTSEWRDMMEELMRLEAQRRRNLNQGLWFNALSVSSLGQMAKPSP